MESRKITITAPNGMHARPAGELVKLIKEHAPSKVMFRTEAREVNASSILMILSLGLKRGAELEITIDGGDETATLDAVAKFIENIRD